MQGIDIIFQLIILFMSVIIHEVSHGYAALFQGDPTAKYENRLTLNPIPHIDIIGTIILPILLFITGSPIMFGWAKPVPFNPYNLKNRRWGEAIVAIAGPVSNIAIAVVFGLVIRFAGLSLPLAAVSLIEIIVLVNFMLALFNLIPIPPLDGSKILFALLPQTPNAQAFRRFIERYSLILVLIVILFLWQYIYPLVFVLASWVTGIPL